LKHGTTPEEAEEAFVSERSYFFSDVKHSTVEKRFILLGKTDKGRLLYISFTKRKAKIRIISARSQSKKERKYYAKENN